MLAKLLVGERASRQFAREREGCRLLAAAAALLLGIIALRLHRIRNRTTDARPDDDTIEALERQESR